MAPIHDTDVAEERWTKEEWRNFELWEKVEKRLKFRKIYWILATFIIFILLSSLPPLMERLPKYRSLRVARKLAQVLVDLKKQSALLHEPLQIIFLGAEGLNYEIRKVSNCRSDQGEKISEGIFSGDLLLLNETQGKILSVPGLVRSFCYDPVSGSGLGESGAVGFGVISVKDLSEKRVERGSFVLIKGQSAEISFE